MTSATLKTHSRARSRNQFYGFTDFNRYSSIDQQKIVDVLLAVRNNTQSKFTPKELPRNKVALQYLLNELGIEHGRSHVTHSRRLGIVITKSKKT